MLLITCTGLLVVPAASNAFVYWGGRESKGTEAINGFLYRANPNGSATQDIGDTEVASGMAKLALGASHIYYTPEVGHGLGRMKLDGSDPEPDFIENLFTAEEFETEGGVVQMVIAGEYVYWANTFGHKIKRSNLNGTEIDREFITGLGGDVEGLATAGSHLYWSDQVNLVETSTTDPGSGQVIGRANLEGGEVNTSFVSGFNIECEYEVNCVAPGYFDFHLGQLAANEEYLYVTMEKLTAIQGTTVTFQHPGGIARVPLGGGAPDLEFIQGFGRVTPERGYWGEITPGPIAATKNYVYWREGGDSTGQSIARADADGSNVRRALVCHYSNNDFSELIESEKIYRSWGGGLIANEGSEEVGDPSPDCALHELASLLRTDSQESFLPLEVDTITINWGEEGGEPYTNTLHYDNGEREITSDPYISPYEYVEEGFGPEPVGLNLGVLGPTYPDSISATPEDYVDERNGHYTEDSAELRRWDWDRPRDPVYARIVSAGEGKYWLEYWYFYYYDESEVAGLTTGSHEGDWEEVQIEVNGENEPEEVAFSEHENGAECEWGRVETERLGHLVDFVAVGTHANYPFPGSWSLPSEVPFGSDEADGEGPLVESNIETIAPGEAEPWVSWPGHWGGTFAGVFPGEVDSPPGPAFHKAWDEPGAWAEELAGCEDRWEGHARMLTKEAPRSAAQVGGTADNAGGPQPTLNDAKFWHGHLWIRYSASDVSPTDRMLVSVKRHGAEVPLSWTVRHIKGEGWVKAPFNFEHLPNAEVLASIFSRNAGRSEIATLPIG